jgi:hypothetical protein
MKGSFGAAKRCQLLLSLTIFLKNSPKLFIQLSLPWPNYNLFISVNDPSLRFAAARGNLPSALLPVTNQQNDP